MEDLKPEPLLGQEPLEPAHGGVLSGSDIGILVQHPGLRDSRLAHVGSVQTDLRTGLEELVWAGIPVVESVEDSGLLKGLAEVAPEGLGGSGLAELVQDELVELVSDDLVELDSDELIELNSDGCSGSLCPSWTSWVGVLGCSTNLRLQLPLHYRVSLDFCLTKPGAASPCSTFFLYSEGLLLQLR